MEESKIQWTDANLTGRGVGRIKQFCKSVGISIEEYFSKRNSGLKWCSGCKEWHKISAFKVDKSRYDGLTSICIQFKSESGKRNYTPKPRPSKGRRFTEARKNDKKQARRRVNYLVEQDLIPHPNKLPCADCGHIYRIGSRRHEYDHFLGYESQNHEKVQSVCSVCHKKRTNKYGK